MNTSELQKKLHQIRLEITKIELAAEDKRAAQAEAKKSKAKQ